jgi:hypothetical protein
MRKTLLIALLLAACSRPTDQAATDNETQPPAAPTPPAPPLKAFELEEKNDLIDFSFAWSAEAAAIPQLVERFRKDMAEARSRLLAAAKADKAEREKQGFPFNGYESSTSYSTAGQSPRLLSLEASAGEYSGGAHPNHGTNALLWDRQAGKEIKVADLFAAPGNRDRLLTQRWCDAINKAREEKRGEPVGGDGMFDECPKLDEIAIVPTDKDGNGRFERLMLIASPYVAGPYVEGEYEVELAVTPDLIAGLKGDYRDSFELP